MRDSHQHTPQGFCWRHWVIGSSFYWEKRMFAPGKAAKLVWHDEFWNLEDESQFQEWVLPIIRQEWGSTIRRRLFASTHLDEDPTH